MLAVDTVWIESVSEVISSIREFNKELSEGRVFPHGELRKRCTVSKPPAHGTGNNKGFESHAGAGLNCSLRDQVSTLLLLGRGDAEGERDIEFAEISKLP